MKRKKKRCPWPGDDPEYVRYHDREWGVPVHRDRRHFEMIVLDGAQAGLSWRTILLKRENYRKAFDSFNVEKVARYNARTVNRLMGDRGIVRNLLKIESAVKNARGVIAIQEEFGSFDAYIWQFVGGATITNRRRSLSRIPARTRESDAMSKDLKRRGFSFVGSTICYAYMQAAGMVNDHLLSCFRYEEVRRLSGARYRA